MVNVPHIKKESEERYKRDEDIRRICAEEYEQTIRKHESQLEENIRKHESQLEEKNHIHSQSRTIISGLLFLAITGNITQCNQKINLYKKIEEQNPKQIHLQYVNKDTLQDLVYNTGEIYLQTKEGNFISYDTILKQEKQKIDSIHKKRLDSIQSKYK